VRHPCHYWKAGDEMAAAFGRGIHADASRLRS
jgi:hypothetical protein